MIIDKTFVIGVIAVILFVILMLAGLYWIFSKANEFFREADRIEAKIRSGDTSSIPDVIALSKKNFERRTNERLMQLVYMAEVKFGVNLIDRA